MTRRYTLKRRAEQKEKTRGRIVSAAVYLHGRVGPALTRMSMVAERAGVQRHTVYAHFPDEAALLKACSEFALDHDPLPDAEAWREIKDRRERLETGLRAVYGWYARNANLAACVLRDAEYHAQTRKIVEARIAPRMQACQEVLGRGLTARQRALLGLAISFFTWRTLVPERGMNAATAVRAMVQAIGCDRVGD